MDLMRYLDKQIPFKVSVGPTILSSYLDKEIISFNDYDEIS